ncbi:MAG: hypothetical protein AAB923_04270, partial [Patescibacteria group bacterium]
MRWAWGLAGVVIVAIIALLPLSFGGFRAPTERAHASATVLFGGDMLFDRYIRKVGETASWDYPFSCIDPVLSSVDLV